MNMSPLSIGRQLASSISGRAGGIDVTPTLSPDVAVWLSAGLDVAHDNAKTLTAFGSDPTAAAVIRERLKMDITRLDELIDQYPGARISADLIGSLKSVAQGHPAPLLELQAAQVQRALGRIPY